jgi:hypothetical protein
MRTLHEGSRTHRAPRASGRLSAKTPSGLLARLVSLFVVTLAAAPRVGIAAETAEVDARLDVLFGEHEAYRNFLHELQSAVSEHARERVAVMVNYPLRTRLNGKWVRLQTPAQFLAHYDDLLTAKTRDVISRQSYGDLFSSSQGVMIGDGEVWYSGVCKDHSCSSRSIKIIAFNPQARRHGWRSCVWRSTLLQGRDSIPCHRVCEE